MFGTIRKHSRWLWIFIVAATILSFVVFSGKQSSFVGMKGVELGEINGRELTRDMMLTARRQAELRRLLFDPQGRQSPEGMERESLSQLLLSEKLKDYQIEIGPQSMAQWIQTQLHDPQSGKNNYETILGNIKSKGFTENDFQEFIRLDVGRRHLAEVVGVSSKLLTPREAEAEFRRESSEAVVSAVSFSVSNYLGTVKMDPVALTQFYSNRVANYRIPERFQVTYVHFPASNYLAQAELDLAANVPDLTNRLEQTYLQQGAEKFVDADGKTLSKEAAFVKMREEALKSFALQNARKKAIEFANELYQISPAKPDTLANFASAKGLLSADSPPFPQYGTAPGLEDLRGLGQEIAKLDADQPYTTPLVGESGAYICSLKRRVPSEVPPYEQVKSRVEEDYRRSQAHDALRTVGSVFHQSVTNGLSQGKNFAAIASEQGHKVIDLPPFSIRSETVVGAAEAHLDVSTLKNAAFAIKPGQASEFLSGRDSGMVIFVKELKPVDEARVKAELPAYMVEQRKQSQMVAFGEWFNKEFERANLGRFLSKKQDGDPQN